MSDIFNSEHPAFEKLKYYITERVRPDACKNEIDQRIWSLFGEKTAVMYTDLEGFSRGVVEFGIIHFLQIIFESQKLYCPCIDKFDGLLIKAEGDSMLIVFREINKAVECAVEMQRITFDYNLTKEDAEKILLCIGLGYGDCLKIGDADIFGAEVNAASKLGEDTARASEILVTADFRNAYGNDKRFLFEILDFIPPGSKEKAYKLLYPEYKRNLISIYELICCKHFEKQYNKNQYVFFIIFSLVVFAP
ncbi:MAG: adenylate/guanylate cyclase domain-containing protein [Bacteroidota bacterium]